MYVIMKCISGRPVRIAFSPTESKQMSGPELFAAQLCGTQNSGGLIIFRRHLKTHLF